MRSDSTTMISVSSRIPRKRGAAAIAIPEAERKIGCRGASLSKGAKSGPLDRVSGVRHHRRRAKHDSRCGHAEPFSVRLNRHLVSLETRLGARLVQRSTRQLSLTSEGEESLDVVRCQG